MHIAVRVSMILAAASVGAVAQAQPSSPDQPQVPIETVASGLVHPWAVDIPDPPARPEFADAVQTRTPVISPSGMVFYTGSELPRWRGSLFISGLSAAAVVRVKLDESGNVAGQDRIPIGARVRDVEQGPDGVVYLVTDERNGRPMRISQRR